MRNKDMKICSPFGSSSKSEEQLPPLDVSKFKWWRCDKCLEEIGIDHESVGDEIGDASVDTDSTTVVAQILLELIYMIGSRKSDKSKEIMDDATNTSNNMVISSWKRNKSICNVVGNKTVKAVSSLGDGTESQIEEIGNLATKMIVSKQFSTRERETNSLVANLLDISTNTKLFPSNNGQRIASDQIEVLGSKEKVLNTSNAKSRGFPSLGSRKGTGTSKGSDTNLAENSLCDLHEDIANDLPRRRKTPKVRLMADLLSGKDNSERRCASTMPMVPSKPDIIVVPNDKVSLLEDINKDIKIYQKKRNTSQEDGSKSGMNLDGDNGSDREQSPQSGIKSVKVKHKNDKDSRVSRKKYKHAQVVDGYSIQIPLEGKTSGLATNGHDVNVLFNSSSVSTKKELPFKEKLDQSLRSFRDAQKHVENDTIQSKSITNCPLTLQKDSKSFDPLRENVFELGQSLGK
ncbi:hypothetical protein HAX54_017554 [Datura stramonium]|uniref:Uncharacterized protein n=1 Tax=Datura stramonium TaxID=4076 RepID=A0ABS8UKY1_DATST|nr:hypothetical protein [Datura stramonium]